MLIPDPSFRIALENVYDQHKNTGLNKNRHPQTNHDENDLYNNQCFYFG